MNEGTPPRWGGKYRIVERDKNYRVSWVAQEYIGGYDGWVDLRTLNGCVRSVALRELGIFLDAKYAAIPRDKVIVP